MQREDLVEAIGSVLGGKALSSANHLSADAITLHALSAHASNDEYCFKENENNLDHTHGQDDYFSILFDDDEINDAAALGCSGVRKL